MFPAPAPTRWRRTTRVALLVVLAGGTLLPAAPAFASGPRVRDVTIDCAGDVVAGHITITNPETGSMRVVLYGTTGTGGGAERTVLGQTSVATSRWENEASYRFTLPSRHKAYRVKATLGSSSHTSAAVGDPTCAPPAQVPEAGLAGLVLLVMAGAAGGVVWFRSRSTVPAGTPAG